MRAIAVGAAGTSQLPGAVVDPAVLAGAAPRSLGVVVGVLVQGNSVEGMEVAEDVTTASAVMPPCKVGEVPRADGLVAKGRCRVGLKKKSVSKWCIS